MTFALPRSQPQFFDGFAPIFNMLGDFDRYSVPGTVAVPGYRHGGPRAFQPKFDVRETEDAYELYGELAGADRRDVSIVFADPQNMTIHGRIERRYTTAADTPLTPVLARASSTVPGDTPLTPVLIDGDDVEPASPETGEQQQQEQQAQQEQQQEQEQEQEQRNPSTYRATVEDEGEAEAAAVSDAEAVATTAGTPAVSQTFSGGASETAGTPAGTPTAFQAPSGSFSQAAAFPACASAVTQAAFPAAGPGARACRSITSSTRTADMAKYWMSERHIGEFTRTFNFLKRVDMDRVSASFKDGILSVVVPKAKLYEARRINIS